MHADAALLERALGNAVDNAVRYGGGAITLSASASAAATVLAVHDDGAGMPAEFLPHAAERFRQAEAARGGPGSGLGLALVDAIVTAHGGQLRICSAGRHHRQPAASREVAGVACAHAESGTTIATVLPAHGDAERP